MPIVPAAKDAASSLWEATRDNPGQIGVSGGLILAALVYSGVVYAQTPGELPPEGMSPDLLLYFAGIQALVQLGAAIQAWAKTRAGAQKGIEERNAKLEMDLAEALRRNAELETKVQVAEAIDKLRAEVTQ